MHGYLRLLGMSIRKAVKYTSFMDPLLEPDVDPDQACIKAYKDEIVTKISELSPSTQFTQILDQSLQLMAHDAGWPLLPECECATKVNVGFWNGYDSAHNCDVSVQCRGRQLVFVKRVALN